MRILMLTNTYLPHVGGVARSVHAFAEEYRRRGHRVLIVAPEFEGREAAEADVIRVPALQHFNGSDFSVRIPVPGFLSSAVEEFQPEVVHSHHPFLLGDAALRIAASRGLPVVFTHHTMYEQYTHYVPGESTLMGRFAIDLTTGYTHLCDAVIAPSESVAAVLRQRGVITPVHVIPTGVDVPHFAQGEGRHWRRELGIPEEAFVVGHVGRLAPEKNLPFLAQAVAEFLRREPKAHFLVVGSGPCQEMIRGLFASRRLGNRLHLVGSCGGQRLVDAYHAMNVFAFASFSETQGMVLTEAMAAGLPVVAVNASGVREVVQEGKNGRLLPSPNSRAFAAALRSLARQSPAEREAMRAAARATADQFSLPRTADQGLALYESLIETGKQSRAQDEGAWETALRRIETEWQLWSNLAQAASATMESPQVFRVPVIGTALYGWRTIRRWFSRSEWGAKLLGLPPSLSRAEQGLILIQIDGLSRTQLERALKRKRLPFLRKLLAREGYQLHTHYSGLPSTTSAVQAELFYGVKTAVPAFGFVDRQQNRIVTMLETSVAQRVQQEISRGRLGLLEGGSAVGNVYTGGAAEPHFCAAAIGWGDLLRYGNPLNILLFVLWNLGSLLRLGGLLLLELILALVDVVRGLIRGHRLYQELKFIPSRLAVTIAMRELMTISAGMAVARGLPVVQLNFLGYDEQAHRRGPDSAFAHWSLKGIDDAIKRVWKAARHSQRRHYVLWVYSDHGQERVTAYSELTGRTLATAVNEVFEQLRPHQRTSELSGRGAQHQRIRYLGAQLPPKFLPRSEQQVSPPRPGEILVAAVGPLGHIALPFALTAEEESRAGWLLVQQAQIPVVLARAGPGEARAWTAAGEFRLPRDAAQVLGQEHPFRDQAAQDLAELCHHRDAGDFVILGWGAGSKPIGFALESGAHGGASPQETSGFALLPADTPWPAGGRDFLRPSELRQMAFDVLGRGDAPRRLRRPPTERPTLRVVTYNVHSCVGLDGRLSTRRVARLLAQLDADVIALQELDVRRARSGGIDQAHELAHLLEMDFHFYPALSVENELYGDAILSRLPMRLVRAAGLPGHPRRAGLEPRGAIWVALDVGGREVQLINTHLGLAAEERGQQIQALLGPDWLGHENCREPVILCGDLNAMPRSAGYRQIANRLRDCQRQLQGHRPKSTWFSHYPFSRIDHLFVSEGLEVVQVSVPGSALARSASDHLPLVVELKLSLQDGQQPSLTGQRQPRSDVAPALSSS